MSRPSIQKTIAPPTSTTAGKLRIEKNIPVPPLSRGSEDRFPWLDMEPGDSFFVTPDYDDDKVDYEKFVGRMAARAQNAGKKHHTKFITRRERQGSAEGVRVWRVAQAADKRANGRH